MSDHDNKGMLPARAACTWGMHDARMCVCAKCVHVRREDTGRGRCSGALNGDRMSVVDLEKYQCCIILCHLFLSMSYVEYKKEPCRMSPSSFTPLSHVTEEVFHLDFKKEQCHLVEVKGHGPLLW